MKVGDLIKHKRTQAIGLILRVPKHWTPNIPYGRKFSGLSGLGDGTHDIYFDIEWYDGYTNTLTSHLIDELVPLEEAIAPNREDKTS